MSGQSGAEFQIDSAGHRIGGRIYGLRHEPAPAPAVVLCTGFGGTQDTPAIVAAARGFARAGFAAVTFDYRGFGTSGGTPRQVVSVSQQLDDIRAVVRHTRATPGIDPRRVALWGSSLGGAHVLTIGAEDPNIAAVIAQVPFNGFPRRVEGRARRDSLRLLRAAVADAIRGWLHRSPRYVMIVGAPRELAVMTSDQANTAIRNLDSPTWRNQVAPRGLLDMMRYRPGRSVSKIDAPLLVCVASRDAETQESTTASLAADAPQGQQLSYDVTHFGIYDAQVREGVISDQSDFLRQAFR